jgi:hypothetical protein
MERSLITAAGYRFEVLMHMVCNNNHSPSESVLKSTGSAQEGIHQLTQANKLLDTLLYTTTWLI